MALSPLGGSGRTYRLANNLTIDYHDFDELETLWTNQVVSDKEVMQIIAASAETMELHAQTPFVMDAVSTSSTARDAIGTSGAGYDAIAAVAMAVGKYAAGIAGLDATTYADIDAVASDSTAMDAVSTSSTAMDAVSMSQTARDVIGTSGVGYDAVAAVAMAIGKYAAGIAGLDPTAYADIDAVASDANAMDAVSTSSTAMDAVSTSQTAMDAVSTSAPAMDAVSASLIARTAAFHSDYSVSSLWASSPGAKTILESGGSPTLPETYDDPRSSESGTIIKIEDGTEKSLPGNATSALKIDVNDSDDQYRRGLTLDLDLSDASTLEFDDRGYRGADSRIKHGVEVGGDTLISNGGKNGWTTRSVDVSSYNGTQPVLFFTDTGSNTRGYWDHFFSNINLI